MPAPKTVIIAGIYRSGSTWLYNAVRLSLIASGSDTYGCYMGEYNHADSSTYHVIKTINHISFPADYVFTSYRNINDIIASMKRRAAVNTDPRFVNETRHENINNYLIELLKWQQKSNYMMWYPEMVADPLKVIGDIATVLNITVDPQVVLAKLKPLKIPETGYDPVTLYHANHITSC